MKRKAIIIGNEGVEGQQGYLAGVAKDLKSYRSYLISPVGGTWYESEIVTMMRPTVSQVRKETEKLAECEYGLVIFSGHGWYSTGTGSTALELRKGEEINSDELRVGAPKQTLILDCCRVESAAIPMIITDSMKFAKAESALNPEDCRKYYNRRITECAKGLVVMHSCSVGETAGDDSTKGGYYSYPLIDLSKSWARDSQTNTATSFDIRSVVQVHEWTVPYVRRQSGQRQNPHIEAPRTEEHFPFCIVA